MTEVPLVSLTNMINGKSKVSKELIFDKSSNNKIDKLTNIWLCRYLLSRHLIYDNGSKFKLHFEPFAKAMA